MTTLAFLTVTAQVLVFAVSVFIGLALIVKLFGPK
jgi:hypothetical protein